MAKTMKTYIIYMPAGGYGSPPYIDHCLGVATDKEPSADGRITMTAEEYDAGTRVGLRAHRCDAVYAVETHGNTVILTPK